MVLQFFFFFEQCIRIPPLSDLLHFFDGYTVFHNMAVPMNYVGIPILIFKLFLPFLYIHLSEYLQIFL